MKNWSRLEMKKRMKIIKNRSSQNIDKKIKLKRK